MTNKEIFNLYEGLTQLGESKEVKLKIQASYCLAYDKNVLEPLYQAIIEVRNQLLREYGTTIDGGWTVPKEKVGEFKAKWDEFMEIENDVILKGIRLQDMDGQVNLELMRMILPLVQE